MVNALIILFSVLILVALVIVKLPLMFWYKRFKMRIWHQFMIWKIERKLQKSSNVIEDSLQAH